MHKFEMPQWAIDRVLERRGRLHAHENLDPPRTALIVVDLQNGFMVEEVAVAYVPAAVEIVPNVNRLAAAVRRTGGKVFWLKHTIDARSLDTWSSYLGMMTPATREGQLKNLAPGSRGHDLYPALDVKPEDEVVQKRRFSGFVQGSSDLPQRLRAQGYDTVLITGTVTNVCCESSARDAMMLNFRTVMVSDANAARSDEEHSATLATFYAVFGDVMDTSHILERLQAGAAGRIAAE
ncbi:MAG: cysteine hydrolase [Hyphomicrobiaceae bacterium]|nr:cysteine hydrolase [Hyphomicrobiaceae bacterium]